MRIRRRRHDEEPVALPSLDRLSGLIERVVELVDAVGETKGAPVPEPVTEAPREPPPEAVPLTPALGWVAFVSTPHGYRLVEGPGPAPASGDEVELEGARRRVLRTGPSPLPGDRRRCAYVAGEEPQQAGRTSDA